jgi:transcriptional antiterminator Rof (Rho-off)
MRTWIPRAEIRNISKTATFVAGRSYFESRRTVTATSTVLRQDAMMSKLLGTDGAYRPISCARYAELESALLRRIKLRAQWRNGNVVHVRLIAPYDLCTRNHEEFLLCRGDARGSGRSRHPVSGGIRAAQEVRMPQSAGRARAAASMHITSPGPRGDVHGGTRPGQRGDPQGCGEVEQRREQLPGARLVRGQPRPLRAPALSRHSHIPVHQSSCRTRAVTAGSAAWAAGETGENFTIRLDHIRKWEPE